MIKEIPIICATTIELPLILQIQKASRVCIYELGEDKDIDVFYLPYFMGCEGKKKDSL